MVEGLTLTFEGGRIVEATAQRGGEAILAELDTHPNARRLGEVALVDRASRVREAGVVFHDTLYDENAGAHIAWGQGSRSACRRAHSRRCSTSRRCTPTSWSGVPESRSPVSRPRARASP